MTHSHILAHDLGTTGNKATLFDTETGAVVASVFEAYGAAYPRPNLAEQDRGDFLGRHERQGHALSPGTHLRMRLPKINSLSRLTFMNKCRIILHRWRYNVLPLIRLPMR